MCVSREYYFERDRKKKGANKNWLNHIQHSTAQNNHTEVEKKIQTDADESNGLKSENGIIRIAFKMFGWISIETNKKTHAHMDFVIRIRIQS